MSATETKDIQVVSPRGFMNPQSVKEGMELAQWIAKSDLAPRDYKDKPQNVLIAMQMGLELGISPMQAIQNISVINGRPSVWGDTALGLCQIHPQYEWHNEKGEPGKWAEFTIKRKGHEAYTVRFTKEMAVTAGLWEKRGRDGQPTPWVTYPDRMLQMRARSWGCRDKFADALRGLSFAEEQEDIIETTALSMPARASEAKKLDAPPPAAPPASPPPPAKDPAPQAVEPIEATITIGEIKKFKDGHFEVLDVEGVIYTTTDEAFAAQVKEAKGQIKTIEFQPVEGKNPVLLGFKS